MELKKIPTKTIHQHTKQQTTQIQPTKAQWVLVNRFRSGHGRYQNFIKKIELSLTGSCKCGADQTANHVLRCTAIGIKGNIAKVDKSFREWLSNTDLKLKPWHVHTHIYIYTVYIYIDIYIKIIILLHSVL